MSDTRKYIEDVDKRCGRMFSPPAYSDISEKDNAIDEAQFIFYEILNIIKELVDRIEVLEQRQKDPSV